MKAEILRYWITGAAYDYCDGEIWQEWKFHNPMMWVWRLALKLGLRSRIDCRRRGDVIPRLAVSMIGEARAHNIVDMVRKVNFQGIPGALVDCGVWRGGSTILMTQANNDDGVNRLVYCCDTFDGFIPGDAERERVACPAMLRVPCETVDENFRKFGVSTINVTFLKGDVRRTLGSVFGPVALLRGSSSANGVGLE